MSCSTRGKQNSVDRFPALGDWCMLTVGCRRADYSAALVARAVEDCNAHLVNLNVLSFGDAYEGTADGEPVFDVVFEVRATVRNATSVARSLERYGFSVLDSQCSAEADSQPDTDRERLAALMRFLNP